MDELNYPLHPANGSHGITIRQQAAIALKVPCSGIPELDAMIRESRRLDMATAAIPLIREGLAAEFIAARALDVADALLAASGKEK